MALRAARSLLGAAYVLVSGGCLAREPAAAPADKADYERGLAADLGSNGRADPALAYRYYQRAALAGNDDAELNLGVMNDSGVGRPANAALAALWYARAASHGNGRAAFDLGQLYEEGDGVRPDRALAAAWYRRASSEGIEAAAARSSRLRTVQATGSVAAPMPLAPASGALVSGEDVEFVWQPVSTVADARYWVEVDGVDGGHAGTIAYQGTDVSSLVVRLPSGNGAYAWRVFAASSGLGHYESSSWSAFSVRHGDECCLAALTTR